MNPDKKLVFIDLDGTLLDNSRKISAHSLRTIKNGAIRQYSLHCVGTPGVHGPALYPRTWSEYATYI